MRKLSWVCDRCGFEKAFKEDDEYDCVGSGAVDGWTVLNHYANGGECETVDLCPECSDEVLKHVE